MATNLLEQHAEVVSPRAERRLFLKGDSVRPPLSVGSESGWFNVATMMAVDAVSLTLLATLAAVAGTSAGLPLAESGWIVSVWVACVLPAYYFFGLYRVVMPPPAVELRTIVLTQGMAALLVLGVNFPVWTMGSAPWVVLSALAATASILLPFVRQVSRRLLSRNRHWGRRVLIVGGNERAAAIARKLAATARLGLRPVGLLEEEDLYDPTVPAELRLGPPDRLSATAEEQNVSMAIFVPRDLEAYAMLHLFHAAESRIDTWMVVPPVSKLPALWTEAFDLTGQPALGWNNHISSWRQRLTKRAFDLTLIALALPVWLPIMLCIALAVKLTSRGPIFFVQERLGYRGRKFRCFKFRTMFPDNQEILKLHLAAHPELKAEWERNFKLKHDPRVTPIGRLLRKTSLDELPQLLNVIRGEMSLVGPRPLLEGELARYGEAYASYKQMNPGITGLWQISGRSNTTFSQRALNDEQYVSNWSPWYDAYILGCTIKVVLRCEGAY